MTETTSEHNSPQFSAIPLSPSGRKEALIWSLVLSAVGISHRVQHGEDSWLILVPADKLDEAIRQIRLYEIENQKAGADFKTKEAEPVKYLKQSIWTLLIVSALMSITFRYEIRDLALKIGAADAGKIVDGQWWRSITALFLHADPSHFLSNMAIGGFIVFWLVEEIGPETGWFLTLFTGFTGNYLTALVHGHDGHISIGASTSVFGALGALVAIRAVRQGRSGLLREAVRAVAAGLALLAMLGSGQGRIDVGAHLFGFISGLFAGVVAGLAREQLSEERWIYAGKVLTGVTIFSAVGAWAIAIFHD